jgi:trigger factor
VVLRALGKTAVQVNVEKLGPCQAKIHFTVQSPEFQATYRRGLQNLSQNANMKGFRPGKVPLQVIEKAYGSQVRNESIEQFVRQAYEEAVKQNELKIVGFQRVNLDEVKILDGVDWSQSFEVSLRPEIELKPYTGLEVESELEAVMDVEIDDALAQLKQQQSKPEPAGEDGLDATGMALIKVEWLAGDEKVLERDGLRVSPKTASPGVKPEDFEAALTGVKDGETRDIPMTFPADFQREELRGKQGTTRVHVSQVFKLIPPSDEDILRMLNVPDAAALRVFVRQRLEEAKQERENQRVESKLLEALIDQHTIDLPEMMIEDQSRVRLEQLRTQMKQQNVPAADIEKQIESQKAPTREAASKGLRALFLVQTIGEKEKLLVTREDMENELQSIAQRNNAKLEEVRKYYQENRLFDQMAVEILERKVRRFLREKAKITTPS